MRRKAVVFQLKNEGVTNSCPIVESGRRFDISVTGPEINVSTASPLAGVALRRSIFVSEGSVEVEYDCQLQKLDSYKL